MPTPSLTPEAVALLTRAARHPEGAAPLLDGHLESAAALYQAHPFEIDALRGRLDEPGMRDEIEAVLARAPLPSAPRQRARPHHHDVDTLLAVADPELLAHGPVETAAVLLQAHPFVVDEARAVRSSLQGRS